MEVTTRTCDICKGAISSYDPDKKLLYQNGPQYQNIQGILMSEYQILHVCLKCIMALVETIDAKINSMRAKFT